MRHSVSQKLDSVSLRLFSFSVSSYFMKKNLILFHLGWPWDRDGSSHPTKTLSHPGPGIEPGRDRELPSHRDLVPSHPMKKNLVPSRSCGTPGWDRDETGHPVPCQEMLLFYNIYINIRTIQLMNISLESAH